MQPDGEMSALASRACPLQFSEHQPARSRFRPGVPPPSANRWRTAPPKVLLGQQPASLAPLSVPRLLPFGTYTERLALKVTPWFQGTVNGWFLMQEAVLSLPPVSVFEDLTNSILRHFEGARILKGQVLNWLEFQSH